MAKPKSRSKSKTKALDNLLGFLPYSGPPKTIREMDEAVAAEAVAMWERFEKSCSEKPRRRRGKAK
jgi:hypothetical protein